MNLTLKNEKMNYTSKSSYVVTTPKPAKDYRNAASSMYHMVCTVYVHTKCGGILANFPQLKFVLP